MGGKDGREGWEGRMGSRKGWRKGKGGKRKGGCERERKRVRETGGRESDSES